MENKQTIIKNAQKAGTWMACRRVAGQLRNSGDDQPEMVINVAFLSSFTVEPVVDFTLVEAADCGVGLHDYIAPYAQVSQEILNPESGVYAFNADVTILIAEAGSLAQNPSEAVDQLVQLSQAWQENTDTGILLISTFIAFPDWPLHILETERDSAIQKANQKLVGTFRAHPRIHIFDLDALAAYHGYANTISPEMDSMARCPFSEGFLSLFARKIISHIKNQCGMARKCLVLDCDNTLWGGIIGEDGIDGITLGYDWPGREYINFQKAIVQLYDQGVILAINSKNNLNDVMQVLQEHPQMLLKEDHFAAICANWDTKPHNMETLANEINIGLDSMVFVDDNPAERELMRQMLPQVAVLDLPDNPAFYERKLRETNYFVQDSLTDEDKRRGQMYAAQRKRSELKRMTPTLADYLKSLQMECSIRLAESKDIKRAAQLTQRTNQFNLTTRRYTEMEIRGMLDAPDWSVYVLGLKDKYGDNGTIGLALVEWCKNAWRIDTFLMSCRVIGRQAEDALVDRLCYDAFDAGIPIISAEYIKSEKNDIVANFWDKMNFKKTTADDFTIQYERDLRNYKPLHFEYLKIKQGNRNTQA